MECRGGHLPGLTHHLSLLSWVVLKHSTIYSIPCFHIKFKHKSVLPHQEWVDNVWSMAIFARAVQITRCISW